MVAALHCELPERTTFVGRARERARLLDELHAGGRLLAVTGPSGIGKTRLAQRLLADVAKQAGVRTAFASALGCTGSADLQVAVAGALGVAPKHAGDLGALLAERGRMLLVLDNLDDIGEAASLLGDWIDRAPALQILTTSIVPLQVEGAIFFELGPLDPGDAVDLYLERAHRAWADRSFSSAEHDGIGELVGHLDRIPLAIELAAARVRVLPPLAMLGRIGRRFEILESNKPGRHGSLLRALTLTWDLLSPEEQRVLARASIFEGGFTLEAAEIFGYDESTILDYLDGLRAKALLQIDDAVEPRFTLYESVRAFAALQLAQSGDAEATDQFHAAFFLREGERHAVRVDGHDAPISIRWLKAERANLIAIVRRSLDTKPVEAARAGLALSPLLALEGPPTSEAELLDATLQAARATAEIPLVVRALRNRAVAIQQHGRLDEAHADLQEALALAREAKLRSLEGHLLVDSGAVQLRKGDFDRATDDLEAAVRIGRQADEPIAEALALLFLGAVERARFSLERATLSYQRSLGLLRSQGHLRWVGIVLLNLGVVRSAQGRFREAREALEEVIGIARSLESLVLEADTLVNFGGIELAANELDAAEAHSLRALQLQRSLGNRRFEALALANLGIISLERGEIKAAEELLAQASRIARTSGEQRMLTAVLPFQAIVEAQFDREDDARRSLAAATDLLKAAGDTKSLEITTLVEAFADLAGARRLGGGRREAVALVGRARARLAAAAAKSGETTDCIFTIMRLLEQELARPEHLRAEVETPVEEDRESGPLLVGLDANWFQFTDGERVDLRRRGNLRRMLLALVERRLDRPGECLSPTELFARGWEGEEIHPEAETARVYTGIWNLRRLGLAQAISRQSEGYLLDPTLQVVRSAN